MESELKAVAWMYSHPCGTVHYHPERLGPGEVMRDPDWTETPLYATAPADLIRGIKIGLEAAAKTAYEAHHAQGTDWTPSAIAKAILALDPATLAGEAGK